MDFGKVFLIRTDVARRVGGFSNQYSFGNLYDLRLKLAGKNDLVLVANRSNGAPYSVEEFEKELDAQVIQENHSFIILKENIYPFHLHPLYPDIQKLEYRLPHFHYLFNESDRIPQPWPGQITQHFRLSKFRDSRYGVGKGQEKNLPEQ